MSKEPVIDRLKSLIREMGRLEAPAVGVLRPEIRSGDKLLLRDPFQGKANTGKAGDKARARLTKGAIGGIVVEWGYDVPPEKLTDFLQFLDDFEEQLLTAATGQMKYRGTYSVFSSTEKNTGQFRTVWTYHDFGDLTALSDEYEGSTQFAGWVKQLRGFADPSNSAGHSQQIYLLASSSRLTDR